MRWGDDSPSQREAAPGDAGRGGRAATGGAAPLDAGAGARDPAHGGLPQPGPDDGGDDVFIHIKQCNGAESLNEGDQVSYDNEWNDRKGKMQGKNCTVSGGGGGGGGYIGGYGGGKGKGKGKSWDPY